MTYASSPMEYHWLVPLAAAISNVFLATLVIQKGPHRATNEIFTFLAVSLVFWNLIYVVLYSVDDLELASSLASFFRAGSLYLFPAVFHLCAALPSRSRSLVLRGLVIGDYACATGLVFANACGLLVTRLHSVGWGYYSTGTSLYDFFSLYVVLNFTGAFLLLIHELRTSEEPRTRLQLKFWLLAFAVSLPLGLTNLLPVYGVEVYPIGNLGSAAWAAVVAYAIVRHRLMDIELAVTKSASYAVVVALLVLPALVACMWMQQWAFGQIHSDFTAGLLVILLLVGVLFPLSRSWVEERLARSFFSEKRELRAMLSEFSRAVLKILDRDRLSRELCRVLGDGLGLESVSVYLRRPSEAALTFVDGYGCRPSDTEFASENAFIRWLSRAGGSVLAEESLGKRVGDDDVFKVFSRNSWHACMPLKAGGVLLGLIALGKKRNLDAFSAGDLEVLSGVAAQASIALENARLYEELRKSQEIINRSDRLSALGTLAAGIAHEIRNPLVSIQTFFQLAPDRLNDDEFRNSFLKLAEGEVARIRDLVGELLSYAKSTAPTIGRVEIAELFGRVSTLLLPHARKKNVDISWQVADPDLIVEADGDQLTQVLINILLNAIQAVPEGGRVTVVASSAVVGDEPFCKLRVEDDGPGVPDELRDVIFNPFFTTKDTGTGLGLAIAHRIVSDCGGYIKVDDDFSEGGAFEILLPRSRELARIAV